MSLDELAQLVNWPTDTVVKTLDEACEEADRRPSEKWQAHRDETLHEWLAELVGEVDRNPEKRMIVQQASVIYFYAKGSVAKAQEAVNTAPFSYDQFTALDLIRIGCISEAFRTALQTLNVGAAAEMMRNRINNPFFELKGRHRAKDFQMILDGALGPKIAVHMKEHLEICPGCTENYKHEQGKRGPVRLDADLTISPR